MMKVLHLNNNYLGTTLHQIMIDKLQESDIDNTVFVPTCSKTDKVIDPKEYVIVSQCYRKNDRILFFLKQKKFYRSLKNNISVFDFDIVHAYTLFNDGYLAYKMWKEYNIPYVVAVRSTDIYLFLRYRKYLLPIANEVLRNAGAIIFQSSIVMENVYSSHFSKHREEYAKKTEIITNGIDDFWFENQAKIEKKRDFESKSVKLLFVGKVDKNKNIPLCVEAVKKLRKSGFEAVLTIVGRTINDEIIDSIKPFSYIKYIPQQPKEKLIFQYQDNDIFVMPSFRETFGLSYVEAMTQGLPVIYTKGQGFDGQFQEGEVGYHVKPDSPDDVVSAVKHILGDYSAMSKRCLADSMEYRWDSIIEKYRELYARLTTV